jgi:hypothetical protein
MGGMAYVVKGGGGYAGLVMLGMFFLLPPPRLLEGGGYLAKIPTYGKHLSHNVYYGHDY